MNFQGKYEKVVTNKDNVIIAANLFNKVLNRGTGVDLDYARV